jgi:hypothetical protein
MGKQILDMGLIQPPDVRAAYEPIELVRNI